MFDIEGGETFSNYIYTAFYGGHFSLKNVNNLIEEKIPIKYGYEFDCWEDSNGNEYRSGGICTVRRCDDTVCNLDS